jgi:molybdopterin/thiamine biosynthesis adenylyltransferase
MIMSIYPRLKPTVQMNKIGELIYLRASGYTSEIENKSGSFSMLLSFMDGTRDVIDLTKSLNEKYPALTTENVQEIINYLDDLFLLEDAATSLPSSLDTYDVERWHRNINFFGSFCHLSENKYDYQSKLKEAKVALLGLGGLGSHILYDLAAMGVQNIRAVEFDKVEISNLNRQILYTEADVGKYKAEIAQKRIKEFSPHLNFEVYNYKIQSTEDVQKAITGCDIVICVADRPKMEILDWVNHACVKENIPLITGGLDTQLARFYSIIPGQTGCISCWRKQVHHTDDFSDQLLTEQRKTQLRGDNAAFVTFVSLITGLMLTEFVKIVTGIKPPQAAGKVLEIDFDRMRIEEGESWLKYPDCEICG